MKIAYIDGRRLRRGLIAGAGRLIESAGFLDRINVFPVADGDTGANMAATAFALSSGLAPASGAHIGGTARLAAEAALAGARGNSGAILAQFFQGLAEDLADEARVGTRRFAQAARRAAAAARAALSAPKEGTIVTVLDDWGESLARAAQRTDDFFELLKTALADARASLERTTELLPELKRAGVVDAGALGFVRLIEGVYGFIQRGSLRDLPEATADEAFALSPPETLPPGEEPSRRYCVEALVGGEGIDLAALRASLERLGDSVVAAGSARLAKAHVHSDDPAAVFAALASFGTVEQPKADDMVLQLRRAAAGHRPCAVVVDSAADLPDEAKLALGVETVPVQVIIEGKSYLDGVGLDAKGLSAYLRTAPARYPTTSQPSAASFSRKFDLALGQADEAVYLGISEALSGTLEAGRRSARAAKESKRLRAFDTRQISVGAGLVALKAAEAAARGARADEVMAVAEDVAARVRLLVAARNLDGLLRSGRLKGMKSLAARAFGLRPVLTVGQDGKAASEGLYLGPDKGVRAILKKVEKLLPLGSGLEALIGHVDAEADATELKRALEERYACGEGLEITNIGPALAVHGGLGAVALAFLMPPESKGFVDGASSPGLAAAEASTAASEGLGA